MRNNLFSKTGNLYLTLFRFFNRLVRHPDSYPVKYYKKADRFRKNRKMMHST